MNLMLGTGQEMLKWAMNVKKLFCFRYSIIILWHIIHASTKWLRTTINHDWCCISVQSHIHIIHITYTDVKKYLNIDHIQIIGQKAPTSRELDNADPTALYGHFLLPHFYLSLEKLQCLLVRDKGRQHDQGTHTWIYETIDRTVSTGALNVIFMKSYLWKSSFIPLWKIKTEMDPPTRSWRANMA